MITLNISTPDSGLGDPLRTACDYININFTETDEKLVWVKGTGGNSIRARYANGIAGGDCAVSLGYQCEATGNFSTATGYSKSLGNYSHSGGYQTVASGQYSMVHGANSTASGSSTIVLGSAITGTQSDTTYVDKLNVKNFFPNTVVRNLGIDSSGNVCVTQPTTFKYRYIGLITQVGSVAPTVTILFNNYNSIPSWSRSEAGIYQGAGSPAEMKTGKTTIELTNGSGVCILTGSCTVDGFVIISVAALNGSYTDNIMTNATITITTY